MRFKPQNLKIPNWSIWFLSSLLFLFIVLTVLRLVYLEPWLKNKLIQTVKKKSSGLYSIQVQTLETSLLSGTLALDKVILTPDYAAWEQKKALKQDSLPATLYQVNIPQLKLQGLNYFGLLFQKPINLSHIQLHRPVILVTQMQENKNTKPLYTGLKGMFRSLRIQELEINEADVQYKNYKSKSNKFDLKGLNVIANDIWLDSLSFIDKKRVYYTQNVKILAEQTNILLPQAMYRLKTGPVYITTNTGATTIKSTQLIPLYSSLGFGKKLGRATPSLNLKVPEIQLSKVNFSGYSQTEAIEIGKLEITNPQLYAYMDSKHIAQKGRKPLLHELIKSFKSNLDVRQANIKNLYIKYEELAPKAVEKGFLTLANMNVSISNISNNKNRMSDKSPAIIKGSAMIMGKAWFKTTIKLNLLNDAGFHTIQGSIGRAKPEIINPIIEPAYYVRVRSGIIQRGNFYMTLNKNRATGTMHLEYDDFKVDLLSKEKGDTEEVIKEETKEEEKEKGNKKKIQSIGKKILSVFANKVVLNTHNNPKKDGPLGIAGFKTGTINTNRRENRSVFTYWIDGLASGVRSTLGLKSQIPDN